MQCSDTIDLFSGTPLAMRSNEAVIISGMIKQRKGGKADIDDLPLFNPIDQIDLFERSAS